MQAIAPVGRNRARRCVGHPVVEGDPVVLVGPAVRHLGGGGQVLGTSCEVGVVGEDGPPPPVVMVLLPLKLNVARRPSVPV